MRFVSVFALCLLLFWLTSTRNCCGLCILFMYYHELEDTSVARVIDIANFILSFLLNWLCLLRGMGGLGVWVLGGDEKVKL